MNKLLLPALISVTALTATAQSKFTPDAQSYMTEYAVQRAELLHTNSTATAEVPTVGALVLLADGYTADDIAAAGFKVVNDLNISAIVEITLDQAEALAELDAVQSITFGGKKKAYMDLARKATGVDNIHRGININGKTHSYTGKGVILGMMDTGFEANHLNFFKYNADGTKGKSRIQRLWHYKSVYASQVDSYTNATIGNFSFDTREESHATHVAGIMTGSYMGDGDYAYTDKPDLSGGLGQLKGQPIPYYGVAPAADLAFSVGGLYDDNILDGVQRIVDYAESMGKTPVINLSLGNNLGPHDGTDTYTRSLNDLGKYAIICMSSGNEGELKMSAEKTLASGDLTLRTSSRPEPTSTPRPA